MLGTVPAARAVSRLASMLAASGLIAGCGGSSHPAASTGTTVTATSASTGPLRTPAGPSTTSRPVRLTVAAHGHASTLIGGLRAGTYPILVDGRQRATLAIGGEPGP